MNMKLLTLIALCAVTSAYKITQLKVPLYADPRRAAELSCQFEMNDHRLHSVKWYRDLNEIFRYNPSQKPTIRLFNVTGVIVEGGECEGGCCMVRVMPTPVATRAAYSCEISTEGPKFLIARETKLMTVVAMPDKDPVIYGAPKLAKPGDQIVLNCSSDYSLPASDINWYINDELQKPELWHRTELSAVQSGGLRASWRILRLSVPSDVTGALRVRCEAVLSVEPPVIRETSVLMTLFSRTHLSKYVSNRGARIVYQDLMLVSVILSNVNMILSVILS
ncbi:uncharacterized protein LOC126976347 isoform X2 [Leptidea sinapis]|uniref:uncharacterized protein LOC126976347 isoform X1 n=1 Tax=Leptidea sinapis TaxID=189913 RepID=UPI002146E17A|nr:uncharacterized protein LOC126976347 isoform X1 [Leptidea sinapis]XP_050680605.1 uncharacterized protein LOC126976347 isoform X2 [Leptidea sinapis]